MDFLRRQNIQVMEWPTMWTDLARIEHVWNEMDRRLRQRRNPPRTLRELGEYLREVWQDIPHVFVENFVASMRPRCVTCINARGGHTRYWTLWTLFWAPLSYDVTNAHVSASIYPKLVVCLTIKIFTAVSKYICVMS